MFDDVLLVREAHVRPQQFGCESHLWTTRDEIAQQRRAMHELRVDNEPTLARREAERFIAQLAHVLGSIIRSTTR